MGMAGEMEGAEGKEETKTLRKMLFFASVCVCLSHSACQCVRVDIVRLPQKGLLRNWRLCGWRCSWPAQFWV